jgi:hypothetical protein
LVAAWAMPLENILDSFLRRFTRLQGITRVQVCILWLHMVTQWWLQWWQDFEGISGCPTTWQDGRTLQYACCLSRHAASSCGMLAVCHSMP